MSDFNHPVNHLLSKFIADLMLFKWVFSAKELVLEKFGLKRFAIVVINVFCKLAAFRIRVEYSLRHWFV